MSVVLFRYVFQHRPLFLPIHVHQHHTVQCIPHYPVSENCQGRSTPLNGNQLKQPLLFRQARHKHLKAFKIFIDPKSAHKGVSYQHLGEEFHYVLKGKIEVMVGENKNILRPDESLHFNSSIIHKLRNLSAQKAELLVVLYTP